MSWNAKALKDANRLERVGIGDCGGRHKRKGHKNGGWEEPIRCSTRTERWTERRQGKSGLAFVRSSSGDCYRSRTDAVGKEEMMAALAFGDRLEAPLNAQESAANNVHLSCDL